MARQVVCGGASRDLGNALVRGNRAEAEPGGVGVGGGVHNLGAIDAVFATIFGNFASTSDNNCFGC